MASHAVVGLGRTGLQIVSELLGLVEGPIVVFDPVSERVQLAEALSPRVRAGDPRSAQRAVLACASGSHGEWVVRLLDAGVDVVSCNDDPEAVAQLLSLHAEACHRGVQLIAGAGFSPGLSELLAVHAAASLESVARVSIAVAGTGGPACARQHHRSLKRDGIEFWEGAWHTRRGGSGRDLVWFPEPIGARDCYHAALASPRLVRRAVSNAKSVAARRSATRRDRSTSRFPMLRPPHADGGPGAIRVEVRGRSGDEVLTVVYGVSCNPAEGAALVATEFCRPSTRSPGAFGAAECGPVGPRLEALRQRGMKIMTYEADVPRD